MRGNLKAERSRLGLSAKELADLVGVTEASILNWEAGTNEPRATSLIRLSQIFRCSPEYLIGDTPKPNTDTTPPRTPMT